uniref:LRRCT domain-containing protein n=1 Tax=Anopheles farauti TaxID=69004 RepID=A0A182QP22_9DIPT
MRSVQVWFGFVYWWCFSILTTGGSVPSTAKICHQYMQCAKNQEMGVSKVTLRFNRTMWDEYRAGKEFDFPTWSWSELDEISREYDLLGVIFNGLEIPRLDVLDGHGSVTSLNLDGNQIATMETEAFAHFVNLSSLSLRNNMLTAVNEALFYFPNQLMQLNLSGNSIRETNGFKGLTWSRLQHLNLSHNQIESVRNQLSKLEALVTLDLSCNAIKNGERPIILPRSVQRLHIDHNNLTAWPFDSVPDALVELSLSFNNIDHTTKLAPSVRRLDLSSNRLASFCSYCFPALEAIDLSSNYFDHFPLLSNSTGVWSVRQIAFNRMPHLRSIEKVAFDGAANLKDLQISFCPRLSSIESNAFTELLQLQRLDLSYNGLQQFPRDMANWKTIKHGVNLQGNPINCNCTMQWLLDDVIPAMHTHRELHHLFENLRCARPPAFREQPLAFLTVHDNMLCRQYREMDLPGMEYVAQLMKDQHDLETIRIQQMILAGLIVAIIITGAYLAHLKCSQPKYTVRPLYYQ